MRKPIGSYEAEVSVGDTINNGMFEARVICVDRLGGAPIVALSQQYEGREKILELNHQLREGDQIWLAGPIKIDMQPGRYVMRDGRHACVWHRRADGSGIGCVEGSDEQLEWDANGATMPGSESPDDLVRVAPMKV